QKMEAEREQEKKDRAESQSRYERENLKAQLKQAREDNDWDKVDEISDKLLDLKVAEKAPQAAVKAQPIDPEVQRDFTEFADRNPWVKTDKKLAKLFAVQLKNVMDAGAADSIPEAMETAKKMLRS